MELKIGQVSKMTGLSPSGIRFLEERGLISPTGGRKGSYRNYSIADVSNLLDYINYRKCGLSLEEIETIVRSDSTASDNRIFDVHCDELENDILEKTRLLHFLRRRSRDAELIGKRRVFFETVMRPAIIWLPLNTKNGYYPSWPDTNGFDIPYVDSILIFQNSDLFSSNDCAEAAWGIGMLESDISKVSFLGKENIEYLPGHISIHCIAEIADDLSLSGEALNELRSDVLSYADRENISIDINGTSMSKRILSANKDGSTCRYDHIWIDIKNI